jgi:ribosome-associated protein
MSDDFTTTVDLYVRSTLAKKAFDLVVLDVRELTSVADAFILCSGRSNRQVTAIAESIQQQLKRREKKPLSVEGAREGHWVLLDYGEVIIHVFYEPVRRFYDLEGLWVDARRITTASMAAAPQVDSATQPDVDEE